MGKEKTHEMLFWTKGEYLKFAEAVMDKPISFYAFEVLYWCGLRLGELLALTLLISTLKRCCASPNPISVSAARISLQIPKLPRVSAIFRCPIFSLTKLRIISTPCMGLLTMPECSRSRSPIFITKCAEAAQRPVFRKSESTT